MTEADIQASIRLKLGLLPHVRMFRNNRGVAWMGKIIDREGSTITLMNARPVEFGLTNGASDLIGATQIVVTPEVVGMKLAIFTAAEVKRPGVTVPTHQQDFLDFVVGFGGRAGVVRCDDDALRLVSI